MRVDTAALRAAAKRLRDEAADQIGQAITDSHGTEERYVIAFAFDGYGSHDAYTAVSQAWRSELSTLTIALRELANAMELAADDYDRADAAAANRLGGHR